MFRKLNKLNQLKMEDEKKRKRIKEEEGYELVQLISHGNPYSDKEKFPKVHVFLCQENNRSYGLLISDLDLINKYKQSAPLNNDLWMAEVTLVNQILLSAKPLIVPELGSVLK